MTRKRSSESSAVETGRQKLLRLLQDEELSQDQDQDQEPHQGHDQDEEQSQDQDQEDLEEAGTSQDNDAWKMVEELDLVKNLLRSTLEIKNREIEFLRKENYKVCEGLDGVEEVWARFETDIKEKAD